MEPALKQRLMGAAVLVALAVIFLPMLFSGPAPPPPAGSLPLDMPAQPERTLQTREIPLALPARPSASSASTAAPGASADPNRLATVEVPVLPPREVPESSGRTDEASASSAETARSRAPVATSEPVPQPASSAPSKPVDEAPAPASVAAPAPAPAPAAQAPASGAGSAGARFVINLGSYSNAANANALLARLKKAGVAVYSESIQVDGKAASRLRAGPYASRGAAEAGLQTVRRAQPDLSVSIVGLDGDEPSPPRRAPAVAGGFVVQVGAFSAESDANTLRARLRSAGYAAFVEKVPREGASLWRVRIGPEVQRAAAEEARQAVKKRFNIDGQILTYP